MSTRAQEEGHHDDLGGASLDASPHRVAEGGLGQLHVRGFDEPRRQAASHARRHLLEQRVGLASSGAMVDQHQRFHALGVACARMTVPDRPSEAVATTLELTGGPMSYVEEGEGELELLLVHGIPGSARDFRWLSHLLAEQARTIRVEMPGFGGTPLATGASPSVEARARFVVEATDALGLRRPVLVGHSMGGIIATMATELAPERYAGVALISSPGLREHRGFRSFPRKRMSRLLSIPGAPLAMRSALRKGFERSGFRHSTHEEIVHTIHCVAATSIREHAARLRAAKVPFFHAFCDDDPLVEVEITSETADALGGPALRFETGGHNPQKHHAVELADALLDWASD